MRFSARSIGAVWCTAIVFCLASPTASAQAVVAEAHPLEDSAISGARVYRSGHKLLILPEELTDGGSVTIPRICGSLREIRWGSSGEHGEPAPSLQPETAEWIVRWQGVPAGAQAIELEFDQEPRLPSELEPVTASGDGSLMLHAYQAVTRGEKLRYEPQTFKNTVGYWTVPTDTASWQLRIDEPGEFNVGILQGCGAGHGGSRAELRLQLEDRSAAALEFEVVETGHFQNFQWRHLGRMAVSQPGVYTLKITPLKIKQGALMDVRVIHLVRLPASTR